SKSRNGRPASEGRSSISPVELIPAPIAAASRSSSSRSRTSESPPNASKNSANRRRFRVRFTEPIPLGRCSSPGPKPMLVWIQLCSGIDVSEAMIAVIADLRDYSTSMDLIFDEPVYEAARQARLRNLLMHFDVGSLAGKRILELGCGAGELGAAF